MRQLLKEVESGKFAKEWGKEFDGGAKKLKKLRKEGKKSEIEKAFKILARIK